MIRKFVATLTLLLGVTAVAGAAPAGAGGEQPTDYGGCIVEVSPAQFQPGRDVTVNGTGLEPNFTSTIEFNSVTVQVGTATTDAEGRFVTQVTIPADAAPGAHTITAVCDADGNIGSSDVTVRADNAARPIGTGNNPLARTGSDTEPLVMAGGIVLIAGTALVMVAKRRRRTAAA